MSILLNGYYCIPQLIILCKLKNKLLTISSVLMELILATNNWQDTFVATPTIIEIKNIWMICTSATMAWMYICIFMCSLLLSNFISWISSDDSTFVCLHLCNTFLWNERDKHNFLSGQFDTNKFVSIKGYAYLLATSHPHKTLYDYFVLSYNIFYWIFSIHFEHANSSMPYSTFYTVDCQLLCSHELSMLWQYMKVYFRVE